jgi:hypothetical protein
VNEIVPILRVDSCILGVTEELCEIFRDHLFGACEMIEDDENDFRFIVMIPCGHEFEIGGDEIRVDDCIHASIVTTFFQDCNPPNGGVDELWITHRVVLWVDFYA